jgi:hypothetical protein
VQHLERQRVLREADDLQHRQRDAALRVDVGEGVGRRDAAVVARVVDDGREEVERLHQADAGRDQIDARVVVPLGAEEHGVVGRHVETGKDLHQVLGGELRRSAGAARPVGQSQRVLLSEHGSLKWS